MQKDKTQNYLDKKEFTINELLFIVKKHYKTIFVVTLVAILLTLINVFLQKPVYVSKAMLMIENTPSSLDIFEVGMGNEKKYLENEIEILKSRTTSKRTIKKLIESEHKNNLYILGTRKYEMNFLQSMAQNFKDIFNSKITNINNLGTEVKDSTISVFAENLRRSTTLSNHKGTDMINVVVRSKDPYEAVIILNALIEEYRLIDLEWVTGEMSHLKSFLDIQLDKKEKELALSEDKLEEFQKSEKIFGVDENSSLLLENLIVVESELYKTKAEINVLGERKKYFKSLLTDEENNLVQSVSNNIDDRLAALKKEIAIKESELISTISQQGESHVLVVDLKDKIGKLKNKLETETRELISKGISVGDPIKYRQSLMDSVIYITEVSARLESKSTELEKVVNNYELELSSLPEKVLEFTRLSRNLNIDAETYSLMRQKLEEARISEASKVGKVRIIDSAELIIDKIKPKKKISLILGAFLGLILGVIIAFIYEYFDYTIKTIEELENYGVSILSIIPSIGNIKNRSKTKKYQKILGNAEKIQRRLITHEDPKSPVSEAYRSLRTSLMYTEESTDKNVILVSSAGPGEGKTTTIVNLAITYANLGKKTILLDTDLRKPVVHKIFSVERDKGITKYLSKVEDDYKKIIYNTEVDNLSLITCGVIPPNPSEILASKRMEELIESLKKDYDVILMDSPPLLAVTDSFVSLKYANQFIIVARPGKTEKAALSRCFDQIDHTSSKLSGVVANAVDESSSYGRGYYYNYYQYYYGDEDK
tara:strand:+ start:4763 stop:7069 length:2307 start_codon:yes stop_codon:yes gene_type:complete